MTNVCTSPQHYEFAFQMGKLIEQMCRYYPELKLVYIVQGNTLQWSSKGK